MTAALVVFLSFTTAFAGEARFKAPRTEFGRPDFQGNWKNANATPWERPDGIDSRLLTTEQAEMLGAKIQDRYSHSNVPEDPDDGYKERSIELIRGELRSSIIVGPADGKLPVTPSFKSIAAKLRAGMFAPVDGPEQLPENVRCLGTLTAPPLLRPLPFVQRFHIVQSNDHILLHSEGTTMPRIVRMNAQHNAAGLRSWAGDSIGWWDGDTLVIETTHFGDSGVRGSPETLFLISPQAVVTERFTLASKDELQYEFTVDDPIYYTRAWQGESQLHRTDEPMYEYACHEGNYSLKHILESARVKDGTLR